MQLNTHVNVILEGCPSMLPSHEVVDHVAICEFRKIPCTLGCGIMIPLRNMTEHAFTTCLNAKILCWQGCGVHVERSNIQPHIQHECQKTNVACPVMGTLKKLLFIIITCVPTVTTFKFSSSNFSRRLQLPGSTK